MIPQLTTEWALCLSRPNEIEILGIVVRVPESHTFRFWNWSVVDGRLALIPAAFIPAEAILLPLPTPLNPSLLQISLARFSLGRRVNFLEGVDHWVADNPPLCLFQWLMVWFLRRFGVISQDVEVNQIAQMLEQEPFPADRENRLATPPFTERFLPASFHIDPRETPDFLTGVYVDRLRQHHEEDVNTIMSSFFETGEFDRDDLDGLGTEIQLALRGDQLPRPLEANGCSFSSADYWVCGTVDEQCRESCSGFVGLLTFYGVPDEIWIGFLGGRGTGWLLTDVAARRARERGFRRLLVWTTRDNARAIDFYRRVGFQQDAGLSVRDSPIPADHAVTFSLTLG